MEQRNWKGDQRRGIPFKEQMKVFIPSYGRAGKVSTINFIPEASIVVPDSQKVEYVEHYGDRVIAIPDELDGSVTRKRNAILNLVDPGEFFWMVDDDLISCQRIKSDVEVDIPQLMESHTIKMIDYDAAIGGVAVSSDPVKYSEYQPFSLTKPCYQINCLKRIPGLFYDENLTRHDDTDYFLKVVTGRHRVFRDNRYFFNFMCNCKKSDSSQKGGIQGGDADHLETLAILKKRWGKLIKEESGIVTGVKTPLRYLTSSGARCRKPDKSFK